jgi:hypothetical protein
MCGMAAVLALAAAAAGCGGDDYTRVEEAPGETPAIVPERDAPELEPLEEGEEVPVAPRAGEEGAAPLPEGALAPGDPVTEPFDPGLDTDRDGILDPHEGRGDADGDGVLDRDEVYRP